MACNSVSGVLLPPNGSQPPLATLILSLIPAVIRSILRDGSAQNARRVGAAQAQSPIAASDLFSVGGVQEVERRSQSRALLNAQTLGHALGAPNSKLEGAYFSGEIDLALEDSPVDGCNTAEGYVNSSILCASCMPGFYRASVYRCVPCLTASKTAF